MTRIAITAEVFEAIAPSLPLGTVSFERDSDDEGGRFIKLPRRRRG